MRFLILLFPIFAFADQQFVPAHVRPDGSYVPPHFRQQKEVQTSEASAQVEGEVRQQRLPVKQPPSKSAESTTPNKSHVYPIYPAVDASSATNNNTPPQVRDQMTKVEPVSPHFDDVQH